MNGQETDKTKEADKTRVLIVDDEDTIRTLLSNYLNEHGYHTVVASSAEEGLAMMNDAAVEIALVDLRLDGMDGLQMLDEIKKSCPDTDVVIISSHASVETAIEAMRKGAYDYLLKPFDDLDVVLFTLQRATDKRRLTRKNEQLLSDLELRNDELSKAVRRLTSLINAGRAMSSIFRLPDLLSYFVDLVAEELDAERVSLMLLHEGSNELHIAAARGIDPEIVRTTRIKVGDGIAGRVAGAGKPLLVKDVRSDPAMGGPLSAGLSDSFVSSPIVLSIPIMLQKSVLGVINVTNKRTGDAFTEEDMAFLHSLAGQAAVAIESTRHFNELQTAYESLKDSQAQLVVSGRLNALGEMAAGVAHDFNNILTGVLGKSQLLLYWLEYSTCELDKLKANLKIIESCALRGAETVRRIQAFTGIRHDVPKEPTDLNDIVREAVEITRHKWKDEREAQGATISIHRDLGPVAPVAGIGRELVQVVSNLIFNAVDAMPEGGILKLSTNQEGDSVQLEVSDSGVGMDEDVRRKVFEPFFTTKEKGNGLGLSVVHGIVAQHGGKIIVSSEKGTGAVFKVVLPVQAKEPAASSPRPRTRSLPSRLLKILVVDDDPVIRALLKEVLDECGHQTVLAVSAKEGLSLFKPGVFDLVITDLGMEGMSGLDFARQLKDLDPRVMITLFSGWALQQREQELKESGIDAVLQKPMKITELINAVEKCMESAEKGVS